MWKALEASTLLRENIFALFGENKAGRKKRVFWSSFSFYLSSHAWVALNLKAQHLTTLFTSREQQKSENHEKKS